MKNYTTSLKSLILLSLVAVCATGILCDTAVADTYTYYDSGHLKTISYVPAYDGKVYEEYLDEDWSGWGLGWFGRTMRWDAYLYGRVAKKTLSAPDAADSNALAYNYTYGTANSMITGDINGDGKDELVVDFGGKGFYKYVNNVWTRIGDNRPVNVISADLDNNGREDLIVDFGTGLGLYRYMNGTTFTKISTNTTKNMVASDLDGNGSSDVVVDFGTGLGLYKYMNGTAFTKISTNTAKNIIAADLDNNGQEDLVVDFGPGLGLYKYMNGATFTKISTNTAKNIIAADLDNNGQEDLVVDFGPGLGLYKYMNGTTFTKINTNTAKIMVVADLDGNGSLDVVMDFGAGLGLYKYMNGTTFTQISTNTAKNIIAADLDNNGQEDLVVDFGPGLGLYKYMNGATFTKISTNTAKNMVVGDLDNSGCADVLVDFGTGVGLYKYMNGSTFIKINSSTSQQISAVDLDGDGTKDDVIIDFGKTGIYKYVDNSVFTQITTLNSDRVDTIKTYKDAACTQLIYTATYDASGTLISKVYTDPVEYYAVAPGLMMRKYESATGNIYEYLNESWNGQGYGRITLIYDAASGKYKTYDWGATQATVNEYTGVYAPVANSAPRSDVVATEKTTSYIYDHNGEEVNLNTATNGWVMREKAVYAAGGSDILEKYVYDATGRLIRDDHKVDNRYYTYEYFSAPSETVVHYKNEYELSGNITMTAYGNAQKSTTQKEFGTASAYLDGSGDYLTAPDSDSWDFGAGDFTLEGWFRFSGASGYIDLFDVGSFSTGVNVYLSTAGSNITCAVKGATFASPFVPGLNQWYHIAVVRNSGLCKIYVNGSNISGAGAILAGDVTGLTNGVKIGYGESGYFNGYVDEVRISDTARWTSNFAAPATEYSIDSNTLLLAHNNGANGETTFTGEGATNRWLKTYEYNIDGTLKRIIYGSGAEYYTPSGLLKRQVDSGNADVYEYLDENWNAQGFGRMTLLYDVSDAKYFTYDWAAAQVTINRYNGTYSFNIGDPVRVDVVGSERYDRLVYDHKNEEVNLDTATNGWILRQQTLYAADGVTMTDEYIYDAQGRITRDDHVAADTYYTYTYDSTTTTLTYKYEYKRSTGTLLTTYRYLNSTFYYKQVNDPAAADSGTVYTYIISGGNSYVNTQVAADGTYTEYLYNSSNVLTGANRYSADRKTLWKLDSGLNVIQTVTPSPAFSRGTNLPWMGYGYDIGEATLGTEDGKHWGFSSSSGFQSLLAKMRTRQGDTMRVFIFDDLRSGIVFDGTGRPTGFTSYVYEDMQALLDIAQMLGIKLIPVLMDFKMADGVSVEGTTQVGEHADLITGGIAPGSKGADFIALMGDFVDYFKGNDNIYAWEVMNEPEEIIYESQATLDQTRTFIGGIVNEIHLSDPGKPVTLGNQERKSMVDNWTTIGLDIYQFHYYNYMESDPDKKLDVACPNIGGKPVIVGELDPTQDGNNSQTVTERLNTVYANGYSGAFFWEDGAPYIISDADYALIKNWPYTIGAPGDEFYFPSNYLKRHRDASSNLYEYLDENWNAQGYGRITLAFNNAEGEYSTYDWAASQVTVNEYQGDYSPASGSAVRSDVVASEKRVLYAYDHHNEEVNLNTATNGWTIRSKTIYDTDGVTVTETYVYDATGRLTRDDHVSTNRYYTYDYFGAPNQNSVHYKYEYEKSTDTLLATYEYNTAGTLVNIVYANGSLEYYAGTNPLLMKRKVENTTSNVYEYLNENYFVPGVGPQGYGRVTLAYSNSDKQYKTYDWGVTQVTVNQYSGVYVAVYGSDVRSDVQASELREVYIYDHHGEEVNLDSATNGWVMRRHTLYDAAGAFVAQFDYNAAGVMTKQTLADGTVYTYYTDTGLVESQTRTTADTYGNLYYHYINENFSGWGHGRVDKQVSASVDGDGARGYVYTFYAGSSVFQIKASYQNVDYSDPSNPVFTTLLATYEYNTSGVMIKKTAADGTVYTYYTSTGLMESKTLSAADASGNLYYHYINENYGGTGYGRVDGQVAAAADADGARAYTYAYHGATNVVATKLCYQTGNYSNPSSPTYTTLLVTYEYNTSGVMIKKTLADGTLYTYYTDTGRLESVTLPAADASGNVYYHYMNENYGGTGYGRVDGQALAAVDADGARAYTYAYHGATNVVQYKRGYQTVNYSNPSSPTYTTLLVTYEYNAAGILIKKTLADGTIYTYYTDTGRLESVTLPAADVSGNLYYHYINENYGGTGYGRVDGQALAAADADGARAYTYSYSGATNRVLTKRGYQTANYADPTNPTYTTLLVTYTNYDDATNRMESKTLVTADASGNLYYHYINENYGGTGYGRVDSQVLAAADVDGARAYTYSYSGATNRVLTKRAYQTADYSNPSSPAYTTLLVTYTFYDDATNRMESKTLGAADASGNVYYHYMNENYGGTGYGRVDGQALAAVDADGARAYTYAYHGATNVVQYKRGYQTVDYSNPSSPTYTTLLVTYEYNAAGNLTEKVSFYNGNWHKESNFTAVLGDGQRHAQRDEVYSNAALTTLVELDIMTYYATGNMQTKEIYDNIAGTKNTNYQKYTFAADGVTVIEKISYYGGNWHKDSNFTAVLGDGYQHPQRSEVYSDAGLTIFVELDIMTYYASGNLHTKEVYDNLTATKNTNYVKYTYAADGVTITEKVSYYGGYWHKESNYTAVLGDGYRHPQRDDIYTDADLTNRVEYDIMTYYASGRLATKAAYNNAGTLQATYTYYDDATNRMESKTLAAADADNNLYFHYINENYGGTGYGRVDRLYKSVADGEGARAYTYSYFGATNRISIKTCYSSTGFTGLVATYSLYNEGFYSWGGRIYQKKMASGRTYTYEAYYTGTDYTAKVVDSDPSYPNTTWYYRSGATETGKRVIETNTTNVLDYKKISGSDKLYHKIDNAFGGEYWYLWDVDIWSGGPSGYKVVYKKQNIGGIDHWYAYPFDPNSSATNPTVLWIQSRDYTGVISTPPYGVPSDPVTYFANYQNADPSTLGVEYPTGGVPLSFAADEMMPETMAEEAMPLVDMDYYKSSVEALMSKYTGAGTTIALLDTGLNADILGMGDAAGYDFAGTDRFQYLSDADYSDPYGHGTETASVIKGTSGVGGVAPEADILALKVFDDKGNTSSEIVANAIRYAVDNGADILAMPFSLLPVSDPVKAALDYAQEKGVVMIAAAGNDGQDIEDESLAAQEGVITVGSVNNDGTLSAWSNTGSEIDLYAPWDVVTLRKTTDEGRGTNEAGTSFSAAFVAGVASLVLSEDPDMTAEDVLRELKIIAYGADEENVTYEEYGLLKTVMDKMNSGDDENSGTDSKEPEKVSANKIQGEKVDEVVSMYEAQRKNKSLFTGNDIKMDVPANMMESTR